ncbi:MAG: DUF308 domain-containing protein [Pseudomonadales bacterium]
MKATGIVLVIVGALAVIFPHVAGVALEVFYGVAFVCIGLVVLIEQANNRILDHRMRNFLFASGSVVIGVLLLLFPLAGLETLTFFIAIVFLLQGGYQLMTAIKGQTQTNRVWAFISGTFGLVVGTLIILQFPSSALWVVGLMAGCNLVILGSTIMTIRYPE